ncbi:MAG: hypothetical protein ACFFDH_08970 [Promethearchaeota archaeon]
MITRRSKSKTVTSRVDTITRTATLLRFNKRTLNSVERKFILYLYENTAINARKPKKVMLRKNSNENCPSEWSIIFHLYYSIVRV